MGFNSGFKGLNPTFCLTVLARTEFQIAVEKCTEHFGGRICGEKDHLEDLDANVTIVLKCILMEWDWRT